MFPTKYKPEYPELLLQMAQDGKSLCHFCARVMIARATFYTWLDTHAEFLAAYNIAKEITESWLTDEGVQGMKGGEFNVTAWSILMRNKCGYVEHRKVGIDFTSCKSAAEKIAVLDKRVAEGRLTPAEAKNFSDYIATAVKIEENTELRNRLEKLEAEVSGHES